MNRKSILLIEDSKLHQSFIERALESSRYDLTIVDTGIDGLAALAKNRFDVVAIDVMLPDINGLSVVRTIREMKQVGSLPVIMITSQSSVDYADDISELNIAAFIEKSSFRAEDFIEQLDKAVDSSEQRSNIEILLLEPTESTLAYIQKATGEPRFIFSQVLDRSTLESVASSSIPDVVVYAHPADAAQSPIWILPIYMDGVLKDVPWIVLFQNKIPRDFAQLSDTRLIMPLATPCSEIVLKKNIELLAQIHHDKMSNEEQGLELELAVGELEKNRLALTQVRSELSQRKGIFGDILLKVGDEIRRPLTSILGYAEGMKRNNESDPRIKNAVDSITNNGRFLTQVVEDVLSIAAIEKNRFKINSHQFDLLAVVNDLREVARNRARANNVTFVVRFENDIPSEVESDSRIIKQILRGLIDNAVKFTHTGSIELKLSYDGAHNQLQLIVADTGPGIPNDKLNSLLSTSTNSLTSTTIAAGSGFGLSYIKFAAEQLGGELRVESKMGVGSTFTVIIDPGHASETISPELAYTILELGAREDEINPASLHGNVLISNVSVETHKLYAYLLDRTNLSYNFVKDEFETLDNALTQEPDLLITDVLQSGGDGYSFIKSLKKRGFLKPILSISPFQFEEEKIRCLDVGCDAYIDTPFRVENFYETLANLLPDSLIKQIDDSEKQEKSQKSEQIVLPKLAEVPQTLLPSNVEDNSIVESLVVEFIDMLPEHLSKIESALLSADFKIIQDSATELLNSSQLYGYPLIEESAKQLLESCEDSSVELAQHYTSHLQQLAKSAKAGRASIVIGSVQEEGTTSKVESQPQTASSDSNSDSSLQKEIHSLFVDEPIKHTDVILNREKPVEVDETGFFSNIPNISADSIEKTQSMQASDLEQIEKLLSQKVSALEKSKGEEAKQVSHSPEPTLEKVAISDNALGYLEQLGDALMRDDWLDAKNGVECFLAEIILEGAISLQNAGTQLKEAIESENLEKSAQLLDEIHSQICLDSNTPAGIPSSGETLDPDMEINALLQELENEVGILPPANKPDLDSEPIISDTSIYKLFDLQHKLEEKSNEKQVAAKLEEESEPVDKKSQEQSNEQIADIQEVDSLVEALGVDIEDDILAQDTQEKEEAVVEGAIYSTLVEDEPSTAPLILDFLEELKDLMVELRSAFGTEDQEKMLEITNEVYGSAGICGYESCAQLAKELKGELDAGNSSTEHVAPLVNQLESVCKAMQLGRKSLLQHQT